jgi:CheY-like chemotaxis protein
MTSALVVDDEYDSRELIVRALESAGVDAARVVETAKAALSLSQQELDEFDLIVVDRNLPNEAGAPPSQQVGDALLKELLNRAPDRPFLVFTAWDDSPLYQTVLQLTRRINIAALGDTVQQVSVLKKDQAVELADWASFIHQSIENLESGVELVADRDLTRHQSRLFRKVAVQHDGSHITVALLSGGRSGEAVWRCEVRDEEGRQTGSFIAKERPPGSPLTRPSLAGIGSIAPSRLVAGHVARIEGICGRCALDVYQAAGRESTSLWEAALDDGERAADCVKDLTEALSAAHNTTPVSSRLDRVLAAFLPWEEALQTLTDLGHALSPSTKVFEAREHQHGDLHGGNILIDGPGIAIIDFDRQRVASRVVDPVTLMLSWFLHPDGPGYQDPDISPSDVVGVVAGDREAHPCLDAVRAWAQAEQSGPRDYWASVLGYCLRQYRYDEVAKSPLASQRAAALVSEAVSRLIR